MESFKDATGRQWDLALTIGVAKKIKSRLKLDLVAGDVATIANDLITSPLLRMDALWIMVMNPGDTDQEGFDGILGAGTFKEADRAFWDELKNFILSLDPVRCEAITQLTERMKVASGRQVELLVELASSDEAVEMMEQTLEEVKAKALESISEMKSKSETAGTLSTESVEPLAS